MKIPLRLDIDVDPLAMKEPFAISGHVFDQMPAIIVHLSDGPHTGRGEASGVYYLNDDVAHMRALVESVRDQVEAGLTRTALQTILPAGGARNALDCAMWELEAARAGTSVWRLSGLDAVRPLVTTMTCGAAAPEVMARDAVAYRAQAIKLKLTGDPALDTARVQAVRDACPDVWLGVDANQGYDLNGLQSVLDAFVEARVALIEQPLPRRDDRLLEGLGSPIPLAADESVQCSAELEAAVGRFDIVNIKLDKCGGLTEALAMVTRARALGLGLMVGNMAGSSWAMAPSFVLGQHCDIVDLDGPLSLKVDRTPAVEYRDGMILCDDAVWGTGA